MTKGCKEILTEENIEFLLNDPILFEKYKKFKINKIVLNNKNMKFCPQVDCGGYGVKENEKYILCTNNHKFCFDCGNEWHGTKECEEVKNILLIIR
jgi:E3 ubiquitin-protein ligase RNF19A